MIRGGDAYAAHERIVAVHPRFTALGRERAAAPAPAPDGDEVVLVAREPARSLAALLADRWAYVRDGIDQTTFYLTDPNSWR